MPPPALRFLHTADWHLGQPYRNVDTLAETLREARLAAVERALDLAIAAEVDFVLVAGDQFDTPQPELIWVERLLEIIAARPTLTVYMIPGNHDPIGAGSIYLGTRFGNRPANLHLFEINTALRLPDQDATLYACPCRHRFGDNPLAWIPPREPTDGRRIALAHGSLTSIPHDDPNYDIFPDSPERYDLDYIALGDWHRANPDPREQPSARMYYCGAPECGGWDEIDVGQALLVELRAGVPPRVSIVPTGRYRWERLERHLSDGRDVDALLSAIDRDDTSTRLVQLTLSGRLESEARDRLLRRLKELTPRYALMTADVTRVGVHAGDLETLTSDPRLRRVFSELARLAADPTDQPPSLPDGLPPLDADIVARADSLARSNID